MLDFLLTEYFPGQLLLRRHLGSQLPLHRAFSLFQHHWARYDDKQKTEKDLETYAT